MPRTDSPARWWRRASFGLHVGAGYTGTILLASFVAFISTRALRSIADGAGRLEALHSRDLIEVGELRVLAERMGGGLRTYLLTGEESDLQGATEGHAAFTRILAALRDGGSPAEGSLLADVARAEERYQDAIAALVEMRELGVAREDLARGYLAQADGRHAELIRAVQTFVVVNEQRLRALGRESELAAERAERLVMTIAALALALALAGGLLVALWITRAYRQAIAAKEALRTRAREQAAIAALGQRALAIGDVDALINGAPRVLQEMLGVEVAIALEPLPGADELLLRAGVGFDVPDERDRARIPIARYPAIGRALADGKPCVVDDASGTFGAVPDEVRGDGVAGIMWVAVRGPTRTYGVLGAACRTRRAFSHDDVVFAEALAHVLGAAIERRCAEQALLASEARLAKAERGQRFLKDAGDVLASSLDFETTLKQIATVAVPAFADWCIVQVGDEDAELRHVVDSAADPRAAALAAELSERALRELQQHVGARRVLESGRAECVADVRVALGEAGSLADALGMRSCMCLPIRGRGRVIIGVMTLIAGRTRAPYGRDDLALAEELTAKAALAIENARLYGEAQDAIRAREEFLMVASHELRTPLTSLKLNLHKLRQGEDDDAGGWCTDHDAMDAVARQVDRLADLVGVLFDGSAIRTGGLHLDRAPADLVSIVESVADRLRTEAGRVGCSIRVHARTPATGEWDGARLRQVVMCLLSNAIKYGKGRPIDVGISVNAVRVRLIVRDRGMGIPRDSVERVFRRFERAVPAREYGGLGLGLFIARAMTVAHSGSICAVSEQGKGATFVVKLPRHAPPADPPKLAAMPLALARPLAPASEAERSSSTR